MDEAAKQRLRVKEESYEAYIEEELSLRKRSTETHQDPPWRRQVAANGVGLGELENTRVLGLKVVCSLAHPVR